jgi:hypothetical protein
MEQFRGYPAQLKYEDKPGHVIYVDSRKSRAIDRDKAAEYLEQLLEWDKQRIRLLKNGNRFAERLVKDGAGASGCSPALPVSASPAPSS